MNKNRLLWLFLLYIFAVNVVNAQDGGDITLTTQAEVDAFNFTSVTSLLIQESTTGDITNLDGLSELTLALEIRIINNQALTNVDGLMDLTSVDQLFLISGNKSLTNLDGLSNLEYVIRSFSITNNESLENVDGLANFKGTENLNISDNASLLNVDGLSNLFDTERLTISNNKSLTNINGLSKFVLTFYLFIENNPALKNLNGLSKLNIATFVRIVNNTSLSEFCGLYNLYATGGNFETVISDNANNPTIEEIIANGPCPPAESQSFIACLLGKNETPPIATDATGGGMFILNERQDTLHFWIRICELSCPFTAAHFHRGSAGVPGPVVKTISFMEEGNSLVAHGVWTSSDAEPLTPSLVADLFAGNIYVNVHTTGFPAGEIRGQLTFDQPVNFYANLDGDQETPPIATLGSGEGSFILSGDGTMLDYEVTVENLSASIAAAHFHKAAFGVPGPVVRGIDFVGNTSSGTWMNTDAQALTPQLVADLLGCYIYVNVHTPNFPAGEVRGQVLKTMELPADMSYMTVWAANSNQQQDNSSLSFYSLAEGRQFKNVEGDITGYTGKKNIVDLTIDIGGNFYFLNNSWTSMLYRINPDQLDLDASTPVIARQIGRTRLSDETLVQLSNIHFIRGKLYGINNETNKLYEVSAFDAVLREIAELSSLDSKASGFTLAADGNVYLLKNVNESVSEVWKFDNFPAVNLSLVTEVASLNNLESFTAHPNGNLYAADKRNLYQINLTEKTVGILKDYEVEAKGIDFNFFAEKKTDAVETLEFEILSGVTSVDQFSALPTEYNLSQNYPNPFNPSTRIKFSLPEAGFVRLNIYNSLGEIVETLVNESLTAGVYESSFNADNLPSGIYIYKIESGKFTSSSKMILMK